jgi:hypothetical protein
MDMIGHEANGMNPIIKPVTAFLKQEVETVAVSVANKYVLPAVSPENNMIKSTGEMDAWFSCHSGNLPLVSQLVNLEA